MFAEIVFPLPFRNSFTYSVPEDMQKNAAIGMRAVASFGKRVLTGFIINITDKPKIEGEVKPIKDLLDDTPVFSAETLKFYQWISEYYLSSLGEALRNASPYGSDIESRKKLVSGKEYCKELLEKEKNKSSLKARMLRIFSERQNLSISHLQKLLNKKNIYNTLHDLERRGAVSIIEEVGNPLLKPKTVKYIQPACNTDEIYELIPELELRSPKQVVILLELLSRKDDELPLNEILKKTGASSSSVKSLIEKGIIKIIEKEVQRRYTEYYSEPAQIIELSAEQNSAINAVNKSVEDGSFGVFLLYGITGSGKTQVYIELAKKVLKKGKSALILVPEISLTPQITTRLKNHFGDLVTVVHSRMSYGERYDSWRGIIKGRYTVIVGARSALFSPIENIGLIVIDEEHDSSYKSQDNIPRYNARDAAVIRGKLTGAPVVLGSATPSVESMMNALSGKYQLIKLEKRIDDARLPVITLVNIAHEKKQKKTEGVFSKTLLDKIALRLNKKESVILLQNRRGFATQVYCEDCGSIECCDECSVSLVHHLKTNLLKCHYCGFTKPVPGACASCGSFNLKFFGAGTQKVEDELEYYFPKAVIKRIDSDSIAKRGELGRILHEFSGGNIDILLGTQMVSKGLDFSRVTLVGVISAETSLWLPDFRADERTFQLLTQVAGRSGRSKAEGEVIIQTHDDKNFVLQRVLEHDYQGFYEREIKNREAMGYPPFTRLCLVEAMDKNEEKAQEALNDFFKYLARYSRNVRIAPPTEAVLHKIKGFYRFHLLIKSSRKTDPGGNLLRNSVMNSYLDFRQKSRYRDVKLTFDIDPQSII